jgi:hypothetical protein
MDIPEIAIAEEGGADVDLEKGLSDKSSEPSTTLEPIPVVTSSTANLQTQAKSTPGRLLWDI